jgi:hypothetical protein
VEQKMKKIILLFLICSVPLFAAKPKIIGGEYFFDTDPGFGNGYSFTVTASTDITKDLSFSTDTLKTGFHYFNVRMKDSLGNWSLTNMGFFYKYSRLKNPPPIVYAEYFIDTDPGEKQATELQITKNKDITILQDFEIKKMATGNHKYYIRVQDSLGAWSFINYGNFLVKLSEIRQLVVNGAGSEICPNSVLTLNFITDMKFNAGNVFTAQLSNENGEFVNTKVIGTLEGDTTGVMQIQMPADFVNSNKYRVRIVSSNPVLNSEENAVDLTLVQPYINITDLSNTQFNIGESIAVDYEANCFNDANIFTLELSDFEGNFTNPISIGTLEYNSSGTISGTIPEDIVYGTNYKVRITGNSPQTTGVTFETPITIISLPVLTTATPANILSTSAKSGGDITSNGGSDVTARGVCWNSTGNPTLDDNTNFTIDGDGTGSFKSTITDLVKNKKYYIRAYATNAAGTGYGEEKSFVTADFNIYLNQGWNIISSNYLPNEPAMESVFSSIVDKVVIVKNNSGSAYIPQWEDNQIGSWDITQGYLLYMSESSSLGIFGVEADPVQTPITLKKGWNIIAYLRNSELDCETAFAGLKENNLLIVKNNNGAAYIPQWEDNQIGNLVPGQGYLIYILEDDVLTYPGN